MSVPAARSYADLSLVRTLLRLGDGATETPHLERLGRAVTADIERLLGVVWDGEDATVRADIRRQVVDGYRIWLDVPLYRLDGVYVGEESVEVTSGRPVGSQGWIRSLSLLLTATAPPTEVTVAGQWANNPGGAPPDRIVDFASWAVAQEWRKQVAGTSGPANAEPFAVTFDNAWTSMGTWQRIVEAYGLPKPHRAPFATFTVAPSSYGGWR